MPKKPTKTSTWEAGISLPTYPQLETNRTVDVAIVGGGITGLTAAYLLAKEGRKVIILEKDRLTAGATVLTTAFLTQIIDTDLGDLVKMFGKPKAKLVVASHGAAIDCIEEIIANEGIEAEFSRVVNRSFGLSKKDGEHLQAEGDVARSLGLKAEFKTDLNLNFKNFGYLEIANQAKFHPRKYLKRLVERLEDWGVTIYEKTEVLEITDGAPVVIKTKTSEIRANKVLVATHTPFNQPWSLYFKKGQYVSYVLEAMLPAGLVPEGIYEDTKDPYHYFRVDAGAKSDRLILGGEDHREDIPVDPAKNYRALEEYLQKTFPRLSYTITREWSGPIIEPIDGLAYIGPLKKQNVFYAFGFSGNGMTYGTIAALMFRDFVLGVKNPWTKVYDLNRLPTLYQLYQKGIDYSRELVGGAVKNTLTQRKKNK